MREITKESITEDLKIVEGLSNQYEEVNYKGTDDVVKVLLCNVRDGLMLALRALRMLNSVKSEWANIDAMIKSQDWTRKGIEEAVLRALILNSEVDPFFISLDSDFEDIGLHSYDVDNLINELRLTFLNADFNSCDLKVDSGATPRDFVNWICKQYNIA